MKKALFSVGLLLSAACLHAQTVYNSTSFESDFKTSPLPEGVTMSTEQGSSHETSENGLVITLNNMGQWKNVLTINFATPLDLSNDAMLYIKGTTETTTTEKTNVRIRLIDINDQVAPSDQQIWRTNLNFAGTTTFDKQYNFAENDMKNNIDLTQIKSLQIQTQDAGPLNGTVTITKIKLGSTPEPQKTFYIDNFDGESFSDDNVSLLIDGGLPYTISDGVLKFNIKSNPSWGQLFELSFQNPIDISACPELELVYTKTGSGNFQARLVDNTGATTGDDGGKIFWNSGTLNFEGSNINLSKVQKIRFYDKGMTGNAEISIDKIRLGKEDDQTTGYPIAINSNIKIYPSVVQNTLHIQGVDNNKLISIYSVSGQQIYSSYNENESIDVSHFTSGIYLVKVSGVNETFKFIKD